MVFKNRTGTHKKKVCGWAPGALGRWGCWYASEKGFISKTTEPNLKNEYVLESA